MKRIFAIIITILLMAGALCITAFAADEPANEPAAGTVLRVSALKKLGSTEVIKDYDNFEDGWNYAMELAGDSKEMKNNAYDRVVVDIYTDWNAVDGKFTDDNGDGFDNDTIYIPEDAKVTLNLNSHTINRGLTKATGDGEVMFINDDADVIINNGTITGGYSNSEGGGLYIEGGANVTLNDVHIVGNKAYNDDGAGIYMYGGSKLTVNGGSFKDNVTDGDALFTFYYGGAVYIKDGTATFSGVEFKNNDCQNHGAAIYASGGEVKIDQCTFDGNEAGISIVDVVNSTIVVKGSTFTNNTTGINLLSADNSILIVDESVFSNTDTNWGDISIIETSSSSCQITNSQFTDNSAWVMYASDFSVNSRVENFFKNCTFNNNITAYGAFKGDFSDIVFYDCSFGDSKFDRAENMTIKYTDLSMEDVVIGVTVLRKDGTEETIGYKFFDYGWDQAIKYAKSDDTVSVTIDLNADWNAACGVFGTYKYGFKNDTLYIPVETIVTIDLNGHTINRGLTEVIDDGEVMYIDEDAVVSIKDGTITGGCSENGAGGIHIKSGANVTLANVNIVGNTTDDDDGGGIALYGATLTMTGGSFQNNILRGSTFDCYGGAIYINNSTATFNGVTFKNNIVMDDNHYGVAIYADNSIVTINECAFDGNGINDEAKKILAATSVIHAIDSSITVKKTSLTNNGDLHFVSAGHGLYTGVSTLIYLDDSTLVMDGCGVSKNILGHLIQATDNSKFFVSGTNMSFNNATVLKSLGHSIDSYFNGCTFDNNNTSTYMGNKYSFLKYSFAVNTPVTFYNCNMGNSTYSNPTNIKFINQNLDSGIVLTISGIKADGTIVKIEDHRSFETGWSTAMELAIDSYWMSMNGYEYIVVDMHTDWIASNGRFTNAGINGIGFNSDTIQVSEGARLILNMNGHTINRGLTEAEANGEVMYIASGADIIISNGTITGGFSNNGAGGIHISGEAKVTLNNVHVDGNKVKGDDGAGIALYGGATLTMNGGSIANNVLMRGPSLEDEYGGGIYIEDSTVALNSVTLKNNGCGGDKAGMIYGSAVYSVDSKVTLKDCTVEGNGVTKDDAIYFCTSTIYANDSTLVIENTSFIGNGAKHGWQSAEYKPYKGSAVISCDGTDLTITGGKLTGNKQVFLFSLWDTVANIDGVDFTANDSLVLYARDALESTFANCKFSAGSAYDEFKYDFQFKDEKAGITFVDCDFGDATFSDKNAVTFVGGTVSNGIGSIFGEGSLAMIIAILAIVASGVSIFLVVYYNKKKTVPVAADGAADAETNEE